MFHVHFIIAGLFSIVLVWVHMLFNNRMEDNNSRLFRNLLLAVFLEVGFDLASTILSNLCSPRLNAASMLCTSMLYLMEIVLCYYMLFYVKSLQSGAPPQRRLTLVLAATPVLIMTLLLVINTQQPLLFHYDENGIYQHDAFYILNYLFSFLFIMRTVAEIVLRHRCYPHRILLPLFEALGIITLCVILQLVFDRVMLISFGICQAMFTLYLNINSATHYLDAVTGALDESYFDRWLKEQLSDDRYIYLTAIHLVNLREIGQVYGSSTSNRLLKEVATRLRPFSHEEDMVRLTAVTLVVHAHSQEAHDEQLNSIFNWLKAFTANREQCFNLRVAVASLPNTQAILSQHSLSDFVDYLFTRQTFSEAVTAVSVSKELLDGFEQEKLVEKYLRRAVDEDLFQLAFQPIWGLKEQRFVTVEVLSRLQHPTLGAISPQRFIDIAERNGTISQITLLQFRRLCCTLTQNPDLLQQLDRIKFNLSALDLVGLSTVQKLLDCLAEHNLPGSKFEFEITESVATRFNIELQQATQLLVRQNISLSLDDFGSGYANLNTVMRLPFRCVKLDRSLLDGIDTDTGKASFYHSLVRMMKTAGFTIVSEGVETRQEAALLAQWGVDCIQGYYYARPVPGEQLQEALAHPLH